MRPGRTVHIVFAAITMTIPAARSLKDKRRVLSRIKERVRHRFNVSVAEIDAQDDRQHAVLGIAIVSNSRERIERILESLQTLLLDNGDIQLLTLEPQWL